MIPFGETRSFLQTQRSLRRSVGNRKPRVSPE